MINAYDIVEYGSDVVLLEVPSLSHVVMPRVGDDIDIARKGKTYRVIKVMHHFNEDGVFNLSTVYVVENGAWPSRLAKRGDPR